MRLLLDQGLSPYAVDALRKLGHDVLHAQDIDMFESPDIDLLMFAAKEDRVVVTLDADFHMLLCNASAK